jgi:hypothetical protein
VTDPRAWSMTEDQLMEEIRALCSDLRLHVFHVRDSRRSWGPGFPDLVIAGPGGILFREAKNARNSLSPEQRQWGSVLTRAGADWSTWRPRDLLDGTIGRQLARIAFKEAA